MFSSLLKDVCAALLEANVNVMLVKKLRENVRNTIDFSRMPGGLNKRRLIHDAIFKELMNVRNCWIVLYIYSNIYVEQSFCY